MTTTHRLWTTIRTASLALLCFIITSATAQTTNTTFAINGVNVAGTGPDTTVTINYSYSDAAARRFALQLQASHDNGTTWDAITVSTVTGDLEVVTTTSTQSAQLQWHAGTDWPEATSTSMRIRLLATPFATAGGDYLVINLSAGASAASYSVQSLSALPTPIPDTYKTTHLLLRRISAGTFAMYSPADEIGRDTDEAYHVVTIGQDLYMGVFEVTQRQYELVMGSRPSKYAGDTRPVEQVSWQDVRGGSWPLGKPASGTFLQRLAARTGLPLDLPTEAQWEYACRAGTTTAFNNGKTIEANAESAALAEVGRYFYNRGDTAHATVGSYLPNAWGLYDMHGNVAEWCLDWYGTYGGDATDPVGSASGPGRITRGGSWYYGAKYCRSAFRDSAYPNSRTGTAGFRVALPASN